MTNPYFRNIAWMVLCRMSSNLPWNSTSAIANPNQLIRNIHAAYTCTARVSHQPFCLCSRMHAMWTSSSPQFSDRSMRCHSTTAGIACSYCLFIPAIAPMHIYHAFKTLETHTFLFQNMVAFFSYISNACHSLSGVTERLQHNMLYVCKCV